jgi:hypothetical protein
MDMTKVVEFVGAKASGSLSWCRRVSSPFSPLTMIYQSKEGQTFVDVDTYFSILKDLPTSYLGWVEKKVMIMPQNGW